jgi:hypothetical protein
MSLNISTASLRSLLALAEKREKLTADLASIEKQIAAAIEGSTPVVKTVSSRKIRGGELGNARLPRAPKKRGKRGAIKNLILAGLKEAGDAGIAVRHLAAKLGLKPGSIHAWLHTTGKKSGIIKSLGKGVFRLEESLGVAAPKVEAPKPQLVGKKVRQNGKLGRKKAGASSTQS